MWRGASTKVGSHSWLLSLGSSLSGPLTKRAKFFHRKILPHKDLKYGFHLCLPPVHCQPEPKQPEVVRIGSLLLTSCRFPLQKHISREMVPCGAESAWEGSRLGHLGRKFPSWLCCCLAVPLLLIDNSLCLPNKI